MRIWLWLLLIVGMLLSYLFVFPVFVLLLILLLSYGVYRIFRRVMTLAGQGRIRHGLLKGHLVARYGESEGSKLYKDLVEKLQKRGYR
jgi:hypothetical protein